MSLMLAQMPALELTEWQAEWLLRAEDAADDGDGRPGQTVIRRQNG